MVLWTIQNSRKFGGRCLQTCVAPKQHTISAFNPISTPYDLMSMHFYNIIRCVHPLFLNWLGIEEDGEQPVLV